jgi:hypothetical protein
LHAAQRMPGTVRCSSIVGAVRPRMAGKPKGGGREKPVERLGEVVQLVPPSRQFGSAQFTLNVFFA